MALNEDIPSKSFDVLEKNMENADEMVNSTELYFTNRNAPNGNKTTRTFAGMNADFDDLLLETGYQIVGDFSDSTKVEITEAFQAYTSKTIEGFQSSVWVTNQALPYTPTGSDPTTGTELGKWNEVAQGNLQSVARALNIESSMVIYGNDTVTILDDVLAVFSTVTEKTYLLDSQVDEGEYIVLLDGNHLTTTNQEVYLRQAPIAAEQTPPADVYLPLGNKFSDTLAGVYTFSRASTSSGVNKSGYTLDYAVDTPLIGSDGLSCYEEVTNIINQSEVLNGSPWSGTAEKTLSNILTSDQSTYYYSIENDAPLINQAVSQSISADFTDGYSFSMEILNGDAEQTRVSIQGGDLTTTSMTINWEGTKIVSVVQSSHTFNVEYYELSNGAYKFNFSCTDDVGSGVGVLYIWPASYVPTGESVGTIYLSKVQLTEGKSIAPYVKTEDTDVTRSPDVFYIPLMDNLPTQGEPFTIGCDCKILDNGKDSRIFSQSNNLFLRRAGSGEINAGAVDGTGTSRQTTFTGSLSLSTEPHRYIFRYDGEYIKISVDGVVDEGSACEGMTLDLTQDLYIGSFSGTDVFLNSEIKNFTIWHRALTDLEVSLLGGVK